MTIAVALAAFLAVAGVAVYAVMLMQKITARAFDHLDREATAARLERDVLLDRLQAPFATQQRLTPESPADLGPDDAAIDREWADMPESAVAIPDDLLFAFTDSDEE